MDNKQKQYQKWLKLKQDGKKSFVIKYGIIRFGLGASILSIILIELLNKDFNLANVTFSKLYSLQSLLTLFMFPVGGIIWCILMWGYLAQSWQHYEDKRANNDDLIKD